jgi:hypothetical protein
VEGLSRPITLCGPPEELDPSPCLRPGEVSLDSRFVLLDRAGLLRFRDDLPAGDLSALAREPRLVVPVVVAGRTLATLDWELRFEQPEDAIFDAAGTSTDGVPLRVRLERAGRDRLVYAVSERGQRYVAVVENGRAAAFHVVSRGAAGGSGLDGNAGSDGFAGQAGSSASCPSSGGSDGSRGGDGSPGGPGSSGGSGGAGGNILVEVACRGRACDELMAIAQRSIRSVGGPGGPGGVGGRGGSGGPGGSGGAGTSCTDADGNVTSLSGGSSGSSGLDGSRGSDGLQGSDGAPGHVELRVVE